MKPDSQNTRILKYLQSGKTLTGMEALKMFNCFSLAQRIRNLKEKGFEIETKMITTGWAREDKKRIARYKML